MKYGFGLAFAVVLTLLTGYWLHPLNAGAVGLVFVVWFSLTVGIVLLTRMLPRKGDR